MYHDDLPHAADCDCQPCAAEASDRAARLRDELASLAHVTSYRHPEAARVAALVRELDEMEARHVK